MRVYLAAIELRSFTKASVAQNISQPAATIIINHIEEVFQCELFERQGATRKAVTTAIGQQVAETFSRVVANYDDELSRIDDLSSGKRAKRLILIQSSFDTMLNVDWFFELVSSFEGDELEIGVCSREAVIEEVKNRKATLGIVDGTVNGDGLDYHQLADYELVLAVPADNESEAYSGNHVVAHNLHGRVHVLSKMNAESLRQIAEIKRSSQNEDLELLKSGGLWPLTAMMKVDSSPALIPAPMVNPVRRELPIRTLRFTDLSLTSGFGIITPWGHLAQMSMSFLRSTNCFAPDQESQS